MLGSRFAVGQGVKVRRRIRAIAGGLQVTDIIDILQKVDDIEHWTRRPGPDAPSEHLALPPLITWRHKQPSDQLAEFFRRVVAGFRGTVSWAFLRGDYPSDDTWTSKRS